MKPIQISYKKTFNLGNYSSEAIGIEFSIDDTDDPLEALSIAKQKVEQFHQMNNPEIEVNGFDPKNPIHQVLGRNPTYSITDIKPEDKEIGLSVESINSCTDKKVLETYKLLVAKDPILRDAYVKRLEELSKKEKV